MYIYIYHKSGRRADGQAGEESRDELLLCGHPAERGAAVDEGRVAGNTVGSRIVALAAQLGGRGGKEGVEVAVPRVEDLMDRGYRFGLYTIFFH